MPAFAPIPQTLPATSAIRCEFLSSLYPVARLSSPLFRCASVPENTPTPMPYADRHSSPPRTPRTFSITNVCSVSSRKSGPPAMTTVLDVGLRTPLAQAVDGAMARNHGQPRCQASTAGCRRRRGCAKAAGRFLQDVFSCRRILQHPERDRRTPPWNSGRTARTWPAARRHECGR